MGPRSSRTCGPSRGHNGFRWPCGARADPLLIRRSILILEGVVGVHSASLLAILSPPKSTMEGAPRHPLRPMPRFWADAQRPSRDSMECRHLIVLGPARVSFHELVPSNLPTVLAAAVRLVGVWAQIHVPRGGGVAKNGCTHTRAFHGCFSQLFSVLKVC